MELYNKSNGRGSPVPGAAAQPDHRLAAFADLVAAVDRHDWRDGQLATRRLRALGFSVCLITPKGDGRRA